MSRTRITSFVLRRGVWVLPLLAGLAAYAVAPFGGLVWDDQLLRGQIVAFHGVGDILRPPDGIPQWTYAYYRPVTILSFIADAGLFGPSATLGPHLANVAFHLLTTFLVWQLLRRLLAHLPQGDAGALAGAVLFAVHPIHAESVSWITGRSDLLATLFLSAAFLTALRWCDRGSLWSIFLSPAFFLLGLLAKEVAIAGLAILPLLIAASGPGRAALNASAGGPNAHRPRRAERAITAAMMLLCWVGAAWYYFALRAGGGTVPIKIPDAGAELAGISLSACAWYLVKLLVPWPQSNFVTADLLPATVVAAMVLAIAGACILASLWHWRRRGDGTPFLGLWWVGAALAPAIAAGLTGVSETPVAERYLYLPSVGAALAFGSLYGNLVTRWARPVGWITAIVAAVYLAMAIQRGTVWWNDLRLWTDATRRMPAHALPWSALGKARFEAGDRQGALQALQQALGLQDDALGRAITLFNLGTIAIQDGDLDLAARHFEDAVRSDPANAQGHYGLGRVFYERATRPGQMEPLDPRRLDLLDQGESELYVALGQDPTSVPIHLVLAMLHTAKGDLLMKRDGRAAAGANYSKAIDHLDAVADLDPELAVGAQVQALRRMATIALREAQSP